MSAVLAPAAPASRPLTLKSTASDHAATAAIVVVAVLLLVFLVLPLFALLQQSVEAPDGRFVGLANFIAYAQTPALRQSLWNSLWISVLVTVIVLPPSFLAAYALTRSRMPGKMLFRGVATVPLLAPSLLSAISLIYWFGNQGVLKSWLAVVGLQEIYGAPGIVLAEVFAVFPHVLMILVTALGTADARLYEAADSMGTTAWRKFFTITLPGARYGLISAGMVSFTLVVTDFGIPKVIGGNFNVLATDVFQLVIGQQDFQRGAVVALLLLTPAVLTFVVDWLVGRKQTAMLSARAVPYRAKRSRGFDLTMFAWWLLLATLLLAVLGMTVFASFAKFWPYDLSPSLNHYRMGIVDAEVGEAFVNSLTMAAGTAFFGTGLVFLGAYLLEKSRAAPALRTVVRLMALLPMAVPGLVLGLGMIFFFNAPSNPLNGLYQTMTLLTLCTIVHFYTTGHLTAVTALKALDGEFEAVSSSLKVPWWTTLRRVTLPICTPALVDIARYFFVNAMTTISAVVFLYSPQTKVASIAILNLDEAGEIGAAAACAVLIAAANAVAVGLFALLGWWVSRRTQMWKEG